METIVFDRSRVEPTDASMIEASEFGRSEGPFDAIVAVGGGSSIDTAKAVNLLPSFRDYFGEMRFRPQPRYTSGVLADQTTLESGVSRLPLTSRAVPFLQTRDKTSSVGVQYPQPYVTTLDAAPAIPEGFDPTDPELNEGGIPHEQCLELRKTAPVFWIEQPEESRAGMEGGTGYWAISKHAHVSDISKSKDFVTSENGAIIRFAADMTRTMSLLGVTSVEDLDRSLRELDP